jgi:hypothetical protein
MRRLLFLAAYLISRAAYYSLSLISWTLFVIFGREFCDNLFWQIFDLLCDFEKWSLRVCDFILGKS